MEPDSQLCLKHIVLDFSLCEPIHSFIQNILSAYYVVDIVLHVREKNPCPVFVGFSFTSMGGVVGRRAPEAVCLGLNPGSTTLWLCDIRQVIKPLCASVFHPQKGDSSSAYLIGLL